MRLLSLRISSPTVTAISGSSSDVGSSNKNQLRVHHQGAGDGHPLLHAAGKLVGHAVLQPFRPTASSFSGDDARRFPRADTSWCSVR